ncbi:MAG: cobaltochelatase subunit CobN [Chloroflexota bacterium]
MTKKLNRVLRPDGRYINVPLQRGQMFVCATGCCCGIVSRGFAPVPTDLYHQEWVRRKMRNKIHLSQGGCLGPCPLANVTTLFFDGRFVGFQAVDDPKIIVAIYDYIEAMLAVEPEESALVPLPKLLEDRTFDYFTWSSLSNQPHVDGDLVPESDGETAADGILFLTQADTDLLAIDQMLNGELPEEFPEVLVGNLNRFRTEAAFADFLRRQLPKAQIVVARLIGGRAGFRLGFDQLVDLCRTQDKELICVSGTADLDPELTAVSSAPLPVIHDVYAYLAMSGRENIENLFRYLTDNLLIGGLGYELPQEQPRHGIYLDGEVMTQAEWMAKVQEVDRPTAAILFYRSHWLTGNTDFIDAIAHEARKQGLNPLPVFTYSLKEINRETDRPAAFDYLVHAEAGRLADVVISTMSFALGKVNTEGATQAGWNVNALQALGVPVLQAIASGMEQDQWELSARGLSPLDTAMNVALPEFDGRIATVPISFKGTKGEPGQTGVEIQQYIPLPERIERLVGIARRMVVLQQKPNSEKKIALILTNAPGKASKIGNAVGLDTPASIINLLHEMQAAGYDVGEIPADGDTLIHTLIDRCSYDTDIMTEAQISMAEGSDLSTYMGRFEQFPAKNRDQMTARWNGATNEIYFYNGELKFAGLSLGNVFIALQPPRGYGMDPDAIYHQPDLPPTHHYAAFYRWLDKDYGIDAIVHMGKHGTLEWLPGKGVGPAADCYPDLFLKDMPLIYPFIINDPGEGMQAKRRAHAVIIDHLMPPMMSAETYGDLEELQQLVDQFYQLEALDPTKLPMLQRQIWDVMERANLGDDLEILGKQTHGDHTHEWDASETEDGTPVTLAEMTGKDFAHLMEDLDGYLCEIGTLQIRDGLHTLGHTIEGEQLANLLFALTRLPNLDVPSLREEVAKVFGFDLDALLNTPGKRLPEPRDEMQTFGDVIEKVDETCLGLIREHVEAKQPTVNSQQLTVNSGEEELNPVHRSLFTDKPLPPNIQPILSFIDGVLLPGLTDSKEQEITQIVNGLGGKYIPAGPSGAPTRGMAHILPTGRNFYAVDPRGIPNQTAWRVGQALADELLAKYLREEGDYPKRVGLSIWGTSAMRTHGDDLAQCFALLGVKPTYQKENRRLIGIEAIPLEALGRPRIDVLMRISGFFRDAFPHLIKLLDEAVQLVANLNEPLDQNFVRAQMLAELEAHGDERQATYRVFGSKPGSYGAGILPLIDEQNWRDAHDFAEAYVNWGGYAYTAEEYGRDQRETFRRVLAGVQVAVKNQDNREHDIFDSDDYLQYHGGMIASIRALSGKQPRQFFGDNADPQRIKVRDLNEEVRRVFRSRVVNPKWMASIRRHGYKGGLELAATVDYLFGYDATAETMSDWMYEQVAEQYLFDEVMQAFLEQSNPWARKAIGERLLEAVERGMWAEISPEMREKLTQTILDAEATVEGRGD